MSRAFKLLKIDAYGVGIWLRVIFIPPARGHMRLALARHNNVLTLNIK